MAGGDSGKSVARMNEIGGECNCCKHFLQAFRLTARVRMTNALGLRAGPPGITPFWFSATECPVRVSVWGIDARSAPGKKADYPSSEWLTRHAGPWRPVSWAGILPILRARRPIRAVLFR